MLKHGNKWAKGSHKMLPFLQAIREKLKKEMQPISDQRRNDDVNGMTDPSSSTVSRGDTARGMDISQLSDILGRDAYMEDLVQTEYDLDDMDDVEKEQKCQECFDDIIQLTLKIADKEQRGYGTNN